MLAINRGCLIWLREKRDLKEVYIEHEGHLVNGLMHNALSQCSHASRKKFTKTQKFYGNIYLKPEESP